MIKVKDVDGRELRGVYRGVNGSLIVQDSQLLQKYLTEKQARDRDQIKIKSLEDQVCSLTAMVEKLLEKLG